MTLSSAQLAACLRHGLDVHLLDGSLPATQAQVVSQTIPLVMGAMPAILRKSADRFCDQKHCTSEQRAAIDKAMSKAIGGSGT